MAEIDTSGGGGKKDGKVRSKKMSTRVDFTPMVDLAFLLITFFMLTTTLSKPQSMELNMPEKDVDKQDQQKINDEQAITIMLAKDDKIYYYEGMPPKDGEAPPNITETSFDPNKGIRKYLLQRNAKVLNEIKPLRAKLQSGQINEEQYRKSVVEIKKNDTKGIIVLIKPHKLSKYKNMVDILDEMAICDVPRYAIVDLAPAEQLILDEYMKK